MLLLQAGHVVPVEGAAWARADVLIDERGRIAAIGENLSCPGAAVIDAAGSVVLPGFVDSHRHVWQAPLRGIGADMSLLEYLEVVLGRILPTVRPEDAYAATLLGAVEAIDAGVTTVFDWSNTARTPEHTDAVVQAYADSGIRAVIGHCNPDDKVSLDRLSGLDGDVTGAMAIVGPEYGPWESAVREIAYAREAGLTVSVHMSGGPPASVIPRMLAAGMLGPDVHLVHVNHATADEVKMLVDSGTGVTVTPLVETLMGHGEPAFGRFREAGGRPALGADVVVNSTVDMFEPMRDVLRRERMRTGDTRAADLLRATTIDGAHAIGLGGETGSLTVGKRADIVLVALPSPGAVVTSATPSDVHTVIVGGRVLKRDGQLVHHDLTALRQQAGELPMTRLARALG